MILVFWGPCQDITLVGSGIGCLMSAKELISCYGRSSVSEAQACTWLGATRACTGAW